MILEHRIGTGKIGGKAAGLLLAYKILQNTAPEIFERIQLAALVLRRRGRVL